MLAFVMAELREAGNLPNSSTGTGNGSGGSNPSLDLAELVAAIQAAIKAVAATLRSSGIAKWRNAREIASELFVNYVATSRSVALLICDEKVIPVECGGDRRGKYVVCISPLDCKADSLDPPSIAGSVFSVHRYLETRSSPSYGGSGSGSGWQGQGGGRPSMRSVLQPGRNLVAAGYSLYGSSTLLVLSTGPAVHLFVLDPVLGEFMLTAPNLAIPARGHTYSVDEGLTYEWNDPVVEYVESKKDPKLGSTYGSHHVGCTVADVHHVLRNGGVYLSPQTRSNPTGKLRLVLEAAPLAHIVCLAGGLATDGQSSLTDCQPESLAHRSPAFLGSREDVRDLLAVFKRRANAPPYSTRPSGLRAAGNAELLTPSPSLATTATSSQGTSKDPRSPSSAQDRAGAEADLTASVAALSATLVALSNKPPTSRPASAVYPSSTGSILGLAPPVQRPVSAVSAPSSSASGSATAGAISPSSLPFSLPHTIPQTNNAKRTP